MSCPRRNGSIVWKHFELLEDDHTKVVCNHCKKKMSRGGKAKNYNTSNMRNHLYLYHYSKVNRNLQNPTSNLPTNHVINNAGSENSNTTFVNIQVADETFQNSIWNYFKVLENDHSKATCNLCNMEIAKYNATYMQNHLNQCYYRKMRRILPKTLTLNLQSNNSTNNSNLEINNQTPVQVMREIGTPQESNLQTTAGTHSNDCRTPRRSKWMLLKPSNQVSEPKDSDITVPISDTSPGDIGRLVGEMIAVDMQPFYMVENVGFKRLIKEINPSVVLPSPKHLATNIIPQLYAKVKDKITQEIKQGILGLDYVCVTTDMYSTTANDDYLSLTVHFLSEDFIAKRFSLEVVPYSAGVYTSQDIAKLVMDTIKQWDLKNVHVIVRDIGENFVTGLKKTNLPHVPCLAHSLQLVIVHVIFSDNDICNLLSNCRQLVTYFKNTTAVSQKLTALQSTFGLPKHKLVLDEPTRWISTFEMLTRIHEQKRAILNVTARTSDIPVDLTPNDWKSIEGLVNILRIFADITKQLTSENCNISEVIPIINGLTCALKKTNGTFDDMRRDLLAGLDELYKYIEENEIYAIATILNPRFKQRIFISSDCADKAISTIRNKLCKLSSARRVKKMKTVKHPGSSLWEVYREIMTNSTESVSKNDELKQYLSEAPLEMADNLLDYWRRSPYTKLRKIAKRYLAAPASTILAERLCGDIGLICDSKGSRLDAERAHMLVFLNKNLKSLNFEY